MTEANIYGGWDKVRELAETLIPDSDRERFARAKVKMFPIRGGIEDHDITGRLLDSPFAELVPAPGDHLTIMDGDTPMHIYGQPMEPIQFPDGITPFIIGEQWGPYKDGTLGYAVAVKWLFGGGSVQIKQESWRSEGDLQAAIVAEVGYGGPGTVLRNNRLMAYAETGYEGHNHRNLEDPDYDFTRICRGCVEG